MAKLGDVGSLPRITSNVTSLLTGNLLALVAGTALYVVLGRLWGPSRLGTFSVAMAGAGLFLFLSDLGMGLLIAREGAQYPGRRGSLLGSGLVVAPVLTALCVLSAWSLGLACGYDATLLTAVSYAGLHIGLNGPLAVLRGAFQSMERMHWSAALDAIERWLSLLAASWIALRGGGVGEAIMAMAVCRALVCALGYAGVRRGCRTKTVADWTTTKGLLRASSPFALNVLLSTAYLQADPVIIASFAPESSVGFYKAAYSLVSPTLVLATALTGALLPVAARTYMRSPMATGRAMDLASKYLLMVGGLLALQCALFSEDLLGTTYAGEFRSAADLLRILAWVLPFRFVNNSLGTALTCANRQGRRTLAVGIGAVVAVVSKLVLGREFGIEAAALGSVVAEAVIFVSLRSYMSATFRGQARGVYGHNVAALALCMVLATWPLLLRSELPWILLAALSTVTYLGTAYVLGQIRLGDVGLLGLLGAGREGDAEAV